MKQHRTPARLLAVLVAAAVVVVGSAGAAPAAYTAPAGASYETPSGLVVTSSVDHEVPDTNPIINDETVELSDASFSAAGDASLTVDQFLGSRTNVSSVDASANAITIDPDDKAAVTVSGGVTELSFSDVAIDGTAQLTYSASGSGQITLAGLDADTEFAATTTGGDVITTGATTGNGEATISVTSATDQEIVLLQPDAPTINNTTASPSGGENVTTGNVTLSTDVADADFGSDGDELTATFYLDGSQVATQTVTSNGTVSATVPAALGQGHTWRVELRDKYGRTTTSETFEFTSPAQLRIYKETAPNELITDESVNLTVRFFPFGDGDVVTRQATDGVVNLTGLPVDEQFVVTIRDNASNRFTYRRVVIDSITEQQAVYLLNESEPNARGVFEIDDPAGQFPPEDTVLYIEKPLTRNGTTKYRTIAGDTFGASGRFPAVLQQDSRYRLRVESQDGSRERVLGFYSVYGPTVETLRIQRVEPESSASAGGIVYGGLTTFQNNTSIAVRNRDLDGAAVQEIEYRIVNGSGAVIVPNTTSTSDEYAAVYPLPDNTTNVTVEYTISFPDGLTSSGSFTVGLVGDQVTDEWPINTQLLSIISWVAILATMGLLVIVNTNLAPIGGVAMATGLTILGTVAIPMPILGLSGVLAALNAFAGGARGTAPVMLVLVIGVAAAMVTASGFAGVWGAPPPQIDDASDRVSESADGLNPNNGPVSGPVSSSESEIVGLITSGLGTLVDLAGAVVLFPLTLMQLGVPAWAAVPLGSFAEILVGVSLIEFATNRDWS